MKWIWILALAACGGGGDAPRTTPLWSDGEHLRDAQGRIALLRGINARVEGVFDVTFDDGRLPVEEIPPLVPAECARMRALGLDLLRLPINWSGIEPERDVYDQAYLGAVDAAIECAWNAGVYVVVDLHEDAYSKEIGEDGAPLWAIVPEPTMLLGGPLEDLGERRASKQVMDAFASFFALGDPHGLQAEFIDMLGMVGARYKDHPGVVGFEIFNEPINTIEENDAFNARAAAKLREVAPDKLVFFEPPAYRNFTDMQPWADAPFPVAGAVYAPHIYTYAFADPDNRLPTVTIDELLPSNANARAEAEAWATPLFIGEFGLGPGHEAFARYIGLQLDAQDELLASSAFWLWKENSQGSWGLFDHDGATQAWSERPAAIAVVSRPYAPRIAGTGTGVRWDAAARTLTVRYTDAVAAPHVVYVPERFAIASATCDGAAVTPAGGPRLFEIACGGGGAGERSVVVTVSEVP
jgi:endoglycosylceramidase